MVDFIVVGSGPAGTWAAKTLAEKKFKVLVLDIGDEPAALKQETNNLYKMKQQSDLPEEIFLGQNYEGLHNVFNDYISPKLKSPLMRFVYQTAHLSQTNSDFKGLSSSAKGGLANVWGGHVYRFNDEELKEFPFKPDELKKFYDRVAASIPISGTEDDLLPFIDRERNLLPPLKLDQLNNQILNRYKKKREWLNGNGLFLGFPRIAIQSGKTEGRTAYDNLDFFVPSEDHLYSPRFTLNELIQNKMIQYIPRTQVKKFTEMGDHVLVTAKDTSNDQTIEFRGKKLLVGAGVLNSTRIVLESFNAFDQQLPFLDNPVTYIPFLSFSQIGRAQETETYNAQLNLVLKYQKDLLFGTFYNFNSLLRSDILFDFPLPFPEALWANRNLLQAMTILQFWYPGLNLPTNTISLSKTDVLKVTHEHPKEGAVVNHIISAMRKLGLWSHASLSQDLAPGSSFHYAGTLPMVSEPRLFQTDSCGKLYSTKRVHIIDSSTFPTLPSKNLTYTIMANAARIADQLLPEG